MEAPATRNYNFIGEVDETSEKELIKFIQDVNNYDDEQSKQGVWNNQTKSYQPPRREPIKINVSSYGGQAYSMFNIITLIRNSRTPIYTYCYGKVMSAGLTIFMSGHKRFVGEYATLMFHGVSSGTYGKIPEMEDSIERSKVVQKMFLDFLYKNTKMKKKKIKEILEGRKDYAFYADEAIEVGVADEIVQLKERTF